MTNREILIGELDNIAELTRIENARMAAIHRARRFFAEARSAGELSPEEVADVGALLG